MVVVSVYYVNCAAAAAAAVSVEYTSIRLPLSQADPIKLLVPNCGHVPSSLEMEEFFTAAEQQQHQAFREREARRGAKEVFEPTVGSHPGYWAVTGAVQNAPSVPADEDE